MHLLNKSIYSIFVFNILIIAFLSSIFINKSQLFYPWHSIGMFVFSALLVVVVVISSYHIGKAVFNTKNNQILSTGFFFTSIGFVLLLVFIVGWFSIIKEFNASSFLVNFTTFIIVFFIVPIFVSKPNKFLLKFLKNKKF